MVFDFHHPLQHKLGVVINSVDRCQLIVTEPKDREKGMAHMKALKTCEYPAWTFDKQRKQKQQKSDTKTKDKEDKTVGMVILLYIKVA